MNMNKLTQKSREAIAAAQTFAQQYGNAQVDQIHLLYALADQEGGLIRQLLQKMDVDPDAFVKSCEDELNRMPKVSGSGREMDKIYITTDLDAALNEAEALAGRMKDEYTSVEHLFLGLMDRANSAVKRVLDAHRVKKDALLRQMQAVRGNTRVTSDQPEDTYDVLAKYGQDLVDLARKQKLDPVIGRDNEIRNVIRILLRKTKNNPV
ncbi:MAG: type VI secretion system ATPase TssH, partial [Clostridia bacterium]|nr:type VI secretion system ATPase TssH [Clostridia bacterium]